jgi:preprotein translocase subunit SecD
MTLQVRSADRAQIQKAAEVIRRRLDEMGVEEPVVTVQGDRISVQAQDVEDPEQFRRVVLSRAQIELHLIRFPAGGGAGVSREEVLQSYHGLMPASLGIVSGDAPEAGEKTTGFYAIERQPLVTGADFATVRPGIGASGQPDLEFTLRPEAAAAFEKETGDNIGAGLAILLNGRVLSAPVIRSRITGRGVVEGGFSEQDVQDLAVVLRSGALPAEFTRVNMNSRAPAHRLVRRVRLRFLFGGLAVLALLIIVMGLAKR